MLIFTTCTANYLAQAKSLGDSILRYNPGYRFCIGLVDRVDGRFDLKDLAPHEVVEVERISVGPLEDMKKRYTLLELSCALKPWFAQYFMRTYSLDKVVYLDTDILVFHDLEWISRQLDEHPILLTPHILSPLPNDGKRPHETSILKTGVYNAGFFAARNNDVGQAFLTWWRDILIDHCYEDGRRGLASDQSWLNFVPLFYRQAKVIDHPGCNMAYWNLHERRLSVQEGRYFANETFPLLFYHFSGYSFLNADLISKHQDRYSFADQPVLAELFRFYRSELERNGQMKWSSLAPVFKKKKRFWFF